MKANNRRVYVTGMGAVTALGRGVSELWNGVAEGKSAVGTLLFGDNKPQFVKMAAPLPKLEGAVSNKYDISSSIAVMAVAEALAQANWPMTEPTGPRTAVIIGTGIGALNTTEFEYEKYHTGSGKPDVFAVPKVMVSAAASQVSMEFGARGPSFCLSSACSSSSQAVGIGLLLIRSGLADRAIVGGTEVFLTHASFRAWETLRVMTPTLCRPFSKGRNGMVLGEGAAALFLESEEAVLQRGAVPIAELAGFGTTSDAGDMLRPDAAGCAQAMSEALADANLEPHEIGYLNAHGTGTILNDQTETEAMTTVFGAHLSEMAVSSTKPIHGHTLGAAGAIELVVTIEALRNQIAPPTINWLEADPHCIANPVPNAPLFCQFSAAMSNSFAFGGINSSLIVRRS